jgi:hypothetical protein
MVGVIFTESPETAIANGAEASRSDQIRIFELVCHTRYPYTLCEAAPEQSKDCCALYEIDPPLAAFQLAPVSVLSAYPVNVLRVYVAFVSVSEGVVLLWYRPITRFCGAVLLTIISKIAFSPTSGTLSAMIYSLYM